MHGILPMVDAPFDYATFVTSIGTILGGWGTAAGLLLVVALPITAVIWGVPKLVKFFKRLTA